MKILLVDDHTLFRDGLALLIERTFPQFALLQAGSIAQALDQLSRCDDVAFVLLDLGLPDASGLSGLARLHENAPQARVIVLSADERAETILGAIDQGAAGFIPKTAQRDVLKTALQTAIDGGVYLPATVGAARPDAAQSAHAVDALSLSPRQLDVLRLLIEGKSNKLICRELNLSTSTVKTHLEAIFRRLDVNSRTQAVVAAARLGLRLSANPALAD
jgi:DNA-binding NarL/FixJ family response regulator